MRKGEQSMSDIYMQMNDPAAGSEEEKEPEAGAGDTPPAEEPDKENM